MLELEFTFDILIYDCHRQRTDECTKRLRSIHKRSLCVCTALILTFHQIRTADIELHLHVVYEILHFTFDDAAIEKDEVQSGKETE